MKRLTLSACIAFIFFVTVKAQESSNTIKNILDNKQFTFKVNTVIPAGGRTRQMNTGFFLQVKSDTLVCYLPYFGRAYSAPVNSGDAGYDFTSTNFTYSVNTGKKKNYEVSVVTKDRMYNVTFSLTAYSNGSAYLRAASNDKQAISYDGKID